MGMMRFIVSPATRLTAEMAQQAYLCGLDRIPWQTRVQWERGELLLGRDASESGTLHIPWFVEGHGLLTIATATLCERAEPYHLPLELARGKISQVRNQLFDWEMSGLSVTDAIRGELREAIAQFGEAVVSPQTTSHGVELADRALRLAVEVGDRLGAMFCEQALAIRRREPSKLATLLGADMGSTPLDDGVAREFSKAFNAAIIPMVWREIEAREGKFFWDTVDQQVQWCLENRLRPCAGPLIQFDPACVPDWLYLCEGDFERLVSFGSEFVAAAVERYRGKIAMWIAAGRVNTGDAFALSEEERVKLTASTIELTQSLDPGAELAVAFDQPWSEYLGRQRNDFPPLHFADALIRADLGVTALVLEINVGFSPGGTLPRDVLEFNRQIDFWSLLGVPLYLMLAVPSSSQPDPLAQRRTATFVEEWTELGQQAWVKRYVLLFLAKANVQGVFWRQLDDSQPHSFPHAGLFDLHHYPKPALNQLAELRKVHLK